MLVLGFVESVSTYRMSSCNMDKLFLVSTTLCGWSLSLYAVYVRLRIRRQGLYGSGNGAPLCLIRYNIVKSCYSFFPNNDGYALHSPVRLLL